MENIFGSDKDLKNEYQNLLNNVLPKLNNCNNCEVLNVHTAADIQQLAICVGL